MNQMLTKCFPGVWKLTLGKPDEMTPHSLFGGREAPALAHRRETAFPFLPEQFSGKRLKNGFLAEIPLQPEENLYGMGLQLHSFRQNGTRKTLRTNADPVKDTGDSHAPVPFYVSTRGYGILADTGKNVTFDFAAARRVQETMESANQTGAPAENTAGLYGEKMRSSCVSVFVPQAEGVSLYIFADPELRGVVERYNLFCGGGAMPPIWGLGNLYRCYTCSNQEDVEEMLGSFRQDRMPISMVGLEPGWHSHSYSCSFEWSRERFPDPQRLIDQAREDGVHVNVWEQAVVHPSCRLYEKLRPLSGSHEIWGGVVPDFALAEARELYGRLQGDLIDQGIDAVKLDECDGSDYTGNWFFPEYAQFPSGLTGTEEKNLLGAMIQRVINGEFEKRNRRTYSQIRANWSYGAPMNFVLYSDLYDQGEFLSGLTTSTFSGLLWSPEVRQCDSAEEVLRRLQMVVFSPLSIINAWMFPRPLWKQFEIEQNKAGKLLPDDQLQDACRELLRLRNRLVPYLYTAFADYAEQGTPPFRAMVMDYPQDPQAARRWDCYLMGRDILVEPILTGQTGREIYLPEGVWYDFWTGQRLEGGRSFHVETEQIPVYVRSGAVLPLADGECIDCDTEIPLELRLYGTDSGSTELIADDRKSLDYRTQGLNRTVVTVEGEELTSAVPRGYRVEAVRMIR